MNSKIVVIEPEVLRGIVKEAVKEALAQHNPEKPDPEQLPELFSRKEAAEFLKVSLGTIDNLSRDGLLQKHYLGNMPRFKREELLQAFEGWQKFQRR
jgi:excisionase family DNA binding protein